MKTILSTIRSKAHYGGQLMIVNYYALNYASALIRGQSAMLNAGVDSAAKPFNVRFARWLRRAGVPRPFTPGAIRAWPDC